MALARHSRKKLTFFVCPERPKRAAIPEFTAKGYQEFAGSSRKPESQLSSNRLTTHRGAGFLAIAARLRFRRVPPPGVPRIERSIARRQLQAVLLGVVAEGAVTDLQQIRRVRAHAVGFFQRQLQITLFCVRNLALKIHSAFRKFRTRGAR